MEDWKISPSKLATTYGKIKLLHGNAWVARTHSKFFERNNCLYDSETGKLLGPIVLRSSTDWHIIVRPGASIECKYLSNFIVKSVNTATVINFKKRKFAPDPDTPC